MASSTPPFKHLPNSVARNKALSPAGLVYIAYRCTFVGNYVLSPEEIARRKLVSKGLGKNAAIAAIAECKAAGYLKRWQPAIEPGTFQKAKERICMPEGGASSYVSRMWFDGSLTVKPLAGLIYLRAGSGKSADTYRRELQKRFGWSRPTASNVVNILMGRGLLDKIEKRRVDGTIESITYTVPRLAADHLARSCVHDADATVDAKPEFPPGGDFVPESSPQGVTSEFTSTVKKPGDGLPGDGLPGDGFSGDYTYSSKEDPYALPTGESLNTLPPAGTLNSLGMSPEQYTFRASPEEVLTLSDLHDIAVADETLLGWIETDTGSAEAVFDDGPTGEILDAVYAVADDRKLRDVLRQASDRRIAYKLLEREGLHAVRWLSATMVGDEFSPLEALAAFVDSVWSRVGDKRGAWLDSYALIGKRLAGEMYGGGSAPAALYAGQSTKAALDEMVAADGAKALAPRLRRDVARFGKFVHEQSCKHRVSGTMYPAGVKDIICNVLMRGMIDGKAVGSIKSWRYFEDAIADEMGRLANEAAADVASSEPF